MISLETRITGASSSFLRTGRSAPMLVLSKPRTGQAPTLLMLAFNSTLVMLRSDNIKRGKSGFAQGQLERILA